jgi:hypothetical protein
METLRAFIQPLCKKNGIVPVETVPEGASMSPSEASDAADKHGLKQFVHGSDRDHESN